MSFNPPKKFAYEECPTVVKPYTDIKITKNDPPMPKVDTGRKSSK